MIIIEEDLILSPDFLYTFALLSETFRKDETIGAIQMWNPNCRKFLFLNLSFYILFHLAYDTVNGSIGLIYRVDNLYGLGYLLRRSFYDKNMKNSFQQCCSKRFEKKNYFGFLYCLINVLSEFGINGHFRRIQNHRSLCRIFPVFFEDLLMEIELIPNI